MTRLGARPQRDRARPDRRSGAASLARRPVAARRCRLPARHGARRGARPVRQRRSAAPGQLRAEPGRDRRPAGSQRERGARAGRRRRERPHAVDRRDDAGRRQRAAAPAATSSDAARRCARRATRCRRSWRRATSASARSRSRRRRLALVEHRPEVALDHFRRAEAILAKAQDANPNRLRAESGLARAQMQAGDLPAARAQAERAVTDARARLGGFPSSLFLGEALLVLGEVAAAQDDRVGGAHGARRGGATAWRIRRRQGAVARRGDARPRGARRRSCAR